MIGFEGPGTGDTPSASQARVEAAKWLTLAARQNPADLKGDAAVKLAELRAKMSAEEKRQADERVARWHAIKPKA
jgi:hypothetical protein